MATLQLETGTDPSYEPKIGGITLICETQYWTETKRFLNCELTKNDFYDNQENSIELLWTIAELLFCKAIEPEH